MNRLASLLMLTVSTACAPAVPVGIVRVEPGPPPIYVNSPAVVVQPNSPPVVINNPPPRPIVVNNPPQIIYNTPAPVYVTPPPVIYSTPAPVYVAPPLYVPPLYGPPVWIGPRPWYGCRAGRCW